MSEIETIKILNRSTINCLREHAESGFLYYASSASLIPMCVDLVEYANKKTKGPYFNFKYGHIWGNCHAVVYRDGDSDLMPLQEAIDLCRANIKRANKAADDTKARCKEAMITIYSMM